MLNDWEIYKYYNKYGTLYWKGPEVFLWKWALQLVSYYKVIEGWLSKFAGLKSWRLFVCLWNIGPLKDAFILWYNRYHLHQNWKFKSMCGLFQLTSVSLLESLSQLSHLHLVLSPTAEGWEIVTMFETTQLATRSTRRYHLCRIWHFPWRSLYTNSAFSLWERSSPIFHPLVFSLSSAHLSISSISSVLILTDFSALRVPSIDVSFLITALWILLCLLFGKCHVFSWFFKNAFSLQASPQYTMLSFLMTCLVFLNQDSQIYFKCWMNFFFLFKYRKAHNCERIAKHNLGGQRTWLGWVGWVGQHSFKIGGRCVKCVPGCVLWIPTRLSSAGCSFLC